MAVYIKKLQEGGTPDSDKFYVGENEWVSRKDLISNLDKEFGNFFNTYESIWNKSQKKQIKEEHLKFLENLRKNNIIGIDNNGNFIIKDAKNSGLDFSENGIGRNYGYFAGRVLEYRSPAKKIKQKNVSEELQQKIIENILGNDSESFESWIKNTPREHRLNQLKDLLTEEYINTFQDENIKTKLRVFKDSIGTEDGLKNSYSLGLSSLYMSLDKNSDAEQDIIDQKAAEEEELKVAARQRAAQQEEEERQNSGIKPYQKHLIDLQLQQEKQLEQDYAKWEKYYTANLKNSNIYNGNDYLRVGNSRSLALIYKKVFGEDTKKVMEAVNELVKSLKNNKFTPGVIKLPNSNKTLNKTRAYYLTALDILTKMPNLFNNPQLNDFEDLDGNKGKTIPGSWDRDTGTIMVYFPEIRQVHRVSVLSNQNLYASTLANIYKIPFQKEGGILKAQYGMVTESSENTADELEYLNLTKKESEQDQNFQQTTGNTKQEQYLNRNAQFTFNPTTPEGRQMLSIAADLTSMLSAYIPGYGTIASGVTGLGSTAIQAYDRAKDPEGFTWGDAGATGLDLLTDIAGMIPFIGPGAKAGKIIRGLKVVYPWAMRLFNSYGLFNAAGSLKKIFTDEKLTVQDYRNIADGIMALNGSINYGAGKVKARSMEATFEPKNTYEFTVIANNGRAHKVTIDDDDAARALDEALKKAKPEEVSNILKRNSYVQDAAKSQDFELEGLKTNSKTRKKVAFENKEKLDNIIGNTNKFSGSDARAYKRLTSWDWNANKPKAYADFYDKYLKKRSKVKYDWVESNSSKHRPIEDDIDVIPQDDVVVGDGKGTIIVGKPSAEDAIIVTGGEDVIPPVIGENIEVPPVEGGTIVVGNPNNSSKHTLENANRKGKKMPKRKKHKTKKKEFGGILSFQRGGVTHREGTSYANAFNAYLPQILEDLKKPEYYRTLNSMQDTYGKYTKDFYDNSNGNFNISLKLNGLGGYQKLFKSEGYDKILLNPNLYKELFNIRSKHPLTGDNPISNIADSEYSGITNYRSVFGSKKLWENHLEELKEAIRRIYNSGYEMYLDPDSNNVYKVRPLNGQSIDDILNQNIQLNPNGVPPILPVKPSVATSTYVPDEVEDVSDDGSNTSLYTPGMDIDYTGAYKENIFGPHTGVSFLRLMNTLNSNRNQLKEQLQYLDAPMQTPYRFDRQVYGDYFAKKAGENQAAQIMSLANQPLTSSAKLAKLGQLQAALQADKIIENSNNIDNTKIEKTTELSNTATEGNIKRANETANKNRVLGSELLSKKAAILKDFRKANYKSVDSFLADSIERPLNDYFSRNRNLNRYAILNELQNSVYDPSQDSYMTILYNEYEAATTPEERQNILTKISNRRREQIAYYESRRDKLLTALGIQIPIRDYKVSGNSNALQTNTNQ